MATAVARVDRVLPQLGQSKQLAHLKYKQRILHHTVHHACSQDPGQPKLCFCFFVFFKYHCGHTVSFNCHCLADDGPQMIHVIISSENNFGLFILILICNQG